MGTSPKTNNLRERLFPDVAFGMTGNNIGKARIETVEEMQKQIIAMANLQSVGGKI